MPLVHEMVRIDRPAKEVFGFLTTPENTLLWMSNLVSYRADGAIEKGTRAEGVSKVAGRIVEWTAEVAEFDPYRTVVWRSIEAPMDFTLEYVVEDVTNDTSQVTFRQEVDELGGFFGRLTDALVTAMYAHDVRSNLSKLKALLEHVD